MTWCRKIASCYCLKKVNTNTNTISDNIPVGRKLKDIKTLKT